VGEQILFLHRLQPGGADRSYGIEVGRLAGLPSPVITRARELLRHLEQEQVAPARRDRGAASSDAAGAVDQLALFSATPDPAAEALRTRLRALDPDTLTPMQALALLAELHAAAHGDRRG